MQNDRTPSTAVLILQLLGYVMAFAAPAAIAAVLLPAYSPWIAVGAVLLFSAVSGFIFGWRWDDPRWARETSSQARNILLVVIWWAAGLAVWNIIRKPSDRALFLSTLLGMVVVLLTIALLPFYLSRAIRSRKSAGR